MSSLKVEKYPDDEIDLVDLFKSLWKQRGMILGITLICISAVIVFHLAKVSFYISERVEYPVSLVFLGEKNNYPNSTPFSPLDLISERVLYEVAQKNKISMRQLTESLRSEYSNSLLRQAELQLGKYLSDSKSPADVVRTAKESLEELRALSRNVITVSVDIGKAGLNANTGKELLADLVEAWARQAIDRGLMNSDISYPVSQYAEPAENNLLVSFEELNKYTASLLEAIRELSEMPGSKSLAINNKGLSDLERSLDTVLNADIIPLRTFAYSNSAVISTQEPGMEIRILSRKRLLELEVTRLNKLIESYNNTLKQISNMDVRQLSADAVVGQAQIATAQFDQALLETLLSLGNKISSTELREQIYKKRDKSIEDRLEIEKEIEILSGKVSERDDSVVHLLRSSLDSAVQSVNSIQKEFSEFVTAYRQTTLNSGSTLYISDASPVVRGGMFEASKRMGLTMAIATVLGLFCGIFMALLRSGLSRSNQEAQQ